MLCYNNGVSELKSCSGLPFEPCAQRLTALVTACHILGMYVMVQVKKPGHKVGKTWVHSCFSHSLAV